MENSNKTSVSIGEILYWLFFGSLLFAKGIGLYDGQAVFKLILVFSVMCLLVKFAIEKYTIAEMFKIIAVIGLTGFTYIVSGEKGMLLYGFMMVGVKYVNMKRLFVVGMLLWTIAFLGVTISSLFHMEETVYRVHAKLGMGHIFRWSLGYPHPNVLQISYLVMAIFVIYLLGDRFKIKHAFWLFLGNCLVFLYSVSYTGFVVVMCLLFGRLYLLFRKKLNVLEEFLLQLIFPICVLVSLVAPVTIKGPAFNVLNQLLSTRMELAWRYLKPKYMSFFGVRLSEITTETLTMDNAYLSAFITYGGIPFTILCIATIIMIYKYLQRKQYLEVLIILVIAIGGLTEPFLYNTSFKNLSFLFMGGLLFDDKKKSDEKSIIKIEKLQSINKTIVLNLARPLWILQEISKVYAFNIKKILAGIIGAVIISIISVCTINYPMGYVVYRVDCADLTKERNYYNEENPSYVNFEKMEEFEAGEEIEYFSGNIVLMEKIRNTVLSIVIGFVGGYTLIGIRRRKV